MLIAADRWAIEPIIQVSPAFRQLVVLIALLAPRQVPGSNIRRFLSWFLARMKHLWGVLQLIKFIEVVNARCYEMAKTKWLA